MVVNMLSLQLGLTCLHGACSLRTAQHALQQSLTGSARDAKLRFLVLIQEGCRFRLQSTAHSQPHTHMSLPSELYTYPKLNSTLNFWIRRYLNTNGQHV